ncbi:MAG: putative metal-dependent TIM-barrel fold hydrolase, partial [Verrucomicrobiales bacterium]
ALKNLSAIKPERVIIDHVEEHTVKVVKDAGMWAGMTLYPESKLTANRAIDIIETYGTDHIWMNSACDWGISDPLAAPKAALEMRRRGHSEAEVHKVFYENPAAFMGQCPKFVL